MDYDRDFVMKHAEDIAQMLAGRLQADPLKNCVLHDKQRAFCKSVLSGLHKENWFIAANRSGKSQAGAYCGAHMARFGAPNPPRAAIGKPLPGGTPIEVRDRATAGWVSALDFPTSRDTLQPKYFDNGMGVIDPRSPPFIPKHEIEEWRVSDQLLKLKNGSIIGFKCLRGDQEVLLSDGTYKPIRELAEGSRISVRSHFGRAGTIDKHADIAIAAYTGKKPLLKLGIQGGRELVCSKEHKIFNGLSWKEASEFKVGDSLPYYGTPEPEFTQRYPISFWLIGFLLGDGSLTDKQVRATICDALVLDRVNRESPQFGVMPKTWDGKQYTLSTGYMGGVQNLLKDVLIGLGVWGLRAREKHVPNLLFQADRQHVCEFLSGLFAADGTLSNKPIVSLSTSSKEMAVGVRRLLDRLKIKAAIYYVQSTDSWRVATQGRHPTAVFLDTIDWVKYPEKAQAIRLTLPQQPHLTPLKIKLIKELPEDDTYEICVPGPHCYMASGIVVHNSADSGRSKFQGSARDWVHLDEEHPYDIYEEITIRVGASPLNFFCTATILPPDSATKGHVSWVFPKIIQPFQDGTLSRARLFGASIYDNPHIPESEISYLESLHPLGSVSRRIRLEGEWLPGIGGARAYPAFDRQIHVQKQPELSPRRPLIWTWDFNVEPMVSLVGQTDGHIYRIHRELYLSEGSVADMCSKFYDAFPNHSAEIWLYGDASGNTRTRQTAKSDYFIILQEMKGYGVPIRIKVPQNNPHVVDRVNAVNRICLDEEGQVRLSIDPSCQETITDMEGVLRDNKGGILKTHNRKDPYFQRTHSSDALGYMLSYEEPVRPPSGLGRNIQLPRPPSYGSRR